MFMFSFIFVIVYGLIDWKRIREDYFIYCLFMIILPLQIQLSRRGGVTFAYVIVRFVFIDLRCK